MTTEEPETTFVRSIENKHARRAQRALKRSHEGPIWEALLLIDEATGEDISPELRRKMHELLYRAHREELDRLLGRTG